MKTPHSIRQRRAAFKPKDAAKPGCDQALRLCEQAAARIKSASNELAACWNSLGREHSTAISPTELLRRRAWCNVLELRLKEEARVLEAARLGLDAAWPEIMTAVRERNLARRFQGRSAGENLFQKSWSFLLQPKSAPGPRQRTSAVSR